MQGLDADLPNASALEDANALALAIIPEGKLQALNHFRGGRKTISRCLALASCVIWEERATQSAGLLRSQIRNN